MLRSLTQGRAYDAVGNVAYVWTNVNGATSDEGFCYDEQNRLTWEATQGTPPCDSPISGGTLSGGTYSNTYAYDALNRLVSVGGTNAQTLAYGPGMQQPSPAPLHGVTSASGTSYAYDAAGDRTNAGSATAMTWDAERRLVGWTSGSGATTGSAAYDGEGNRVALQTITTSAPPPTPGRVKVKPLGPVGYSSTTSTTYYLLGLEDVTAGVITKYLGVGAGLPSAVRVGTTLSYLATDGIGSVSEALDTAGNVTAQQLYAPYGRVRYSVGALPTTKGYAGQRQDASSGLNDDAARYYDSSTAQFASADTASDPGNGLDRLAYVGGNPETLTDPTGHRMVCGADCNPGNPDYDSSTGTKVDPNGGPGSLTASATEAVIGPGKVVSISENDTDPTVYAWGDRQMGAVAFAFTGTQIDNLIRLDKAVLKQCSTGSCFWSTAALIGLFAAAFGLIGAAVGSAVGPEGTIAGFFTGEMIGGAIGAFLGALAGSFVAWVMNSNADDINQAIDDLSSVRSVGRTVIYATVWADLPQVGPFVRQEAVGSDSFQTNMLDTQMWIGHELEKGCLPVNENAGQTGSYTGPCK